MSTQYAQYQRNDPFGKVLDNKMVDMRSSPKIKLVDRGAKMLVQNLDLPTRKHILYCSNTVACKAMDAFSLAHNHSTGL
ncbi:MAG: hypothetical protein IPO07_15825 [Haliscomenobacter sp.]|nr:hypothetical protein [Haliscomenobacter sp.]MBK9490070.1 hypothetical protein [Haliscomenobacter sp.]